MANAQFDGPLTDQDYMACALALARKGAGWVDPNPMVGCILVQDGEVIGMGYHTKYGNLHAEREALADCAARGNDACGATAYVTLEPCAHFGKTPPCADALIEAQVARVVIGSADPNPLVAGAGIDKLKRAGIEVCEGVLEDECNALNAPFFHYISSKMPFVVAKFASTLDGKIATRSGASKWITGATARARVHEDRARYAAIMVGVGTVLADDPMLNCRLDVLPDSSIDAVGKLLDGYSACSDLGPHQPVRVIVDTHLRTPLDAQVVLSANDQPTWIATCVSDEDALRPYKDAGCTVIVAEERDGHVCLSSLFATLGSLGIDSVYVEGGATLLGSLFDARIPNRVEAYIAPKIFGGVEAPSPVAGIGVELPAQAAVLTDASVEILGDDILVCGNVSWSDNEA